MAARLSPLQPASCGESGRDLSPGEAVESLWPLPPQGHALALAVQPPQIAERNRPLVTNVPLPSPTDPFLPIRVTVPVELIPDTFTFDGLKIDVTSFVHWDSYAGRYGPPDLLSRRFLAERFGSKFLRPVRKRDLLRKEARQVAHLPADAIVGYLIMHDHLYPPDTGITRAGTRVLFSVRPWLSSYVQVQPDVVLQRCGLDAAFGELCLGDLLQHTGASHLDGLRLHLGLMAGIFVYSRGLAWSDFAKILDQPDVRSSVGLTELYREIEVEDGVDGATLIPFWEGSFRSVFPRTTYINHKTNVGRGIACRVSRDLLVKLYSSSGQPKLELAFQKRSRFVRALVDGLANADVDALMAVVRNEAGPWLRAAWKVGKRLERTPPVVHDELYERLARAVEDPAGRSSIRGPQYETQRAVLRLIYALRGGRALRRDEVATIASAAAVDQCVRHGLVYWFHWGRDGRRLFLRLTEPIGWYGDEDRISLDVRFRAHFVEKRRVGHRRRAP